MATTRIGEPKPDPMGMWTSRRVTRDRKFYGWIRSYKGGRLNVYWAQRRTDEFFFADQTWAVDVDTVNELRKYAVTHIGIEVEDGTKLLAPITLFSTSEDSKAKGVVIRNYEKHKGAKGRLGALQFYVPEKLFAIKRPPAEVREVAMVGRMHLAKTRA